jgi:hypothetical protein
VPPNGLEAPRPNPPNKGVGIELATSLYPKGKTIPETLIVTWVVFAMEGFRAMYPSGSDIFGINGIPIGAWDDVTFLVGIVATCGTKVEWAIWREMVERGPNDCVSDMMV